MKETGLRTVFKWMMALLALIMCATACNDPYDRDEVVTNSSDTIVKARGYEYETKLTHYFDTALKVKISDQMVSKLTIWRTSGGQRVEKVFDNEADPKMEAHSVLAREDYNIKADQLNILPSAERVVRVPEVRDSDGVTRYELDTVYYSFPDAQIMSIPIKITNKTVVVANYLYPYAGLTFDHAEFVHLRNTLHTTRAEQIKTTYGTEYKAFLYFKETNVANPRMLKLPIYAFTKRYVLTDDEIEEVRAENKLRELIDSLTERCSFDRVTIYKSGESARDRISIILQHKVAGIDPYSKVVDNFDHQLMRSHGIASGAESENRTEGKWTVWRRTDGYSADIENGVAADKVVTDYSLMHERCRYKEYIDNDSLVVDFGYENYRVSEKKTTVTPRASDRQGYDEALLDNHINATYMDLTQDVSEFVYLYKVTKVVTKYEFENPSLTVYRDSVVGKIDFIRHFNDGTVERIHDHINQPKSLICTTNWESIQRVATQVTDSAVQVNLLSVQNASEGYWRFQRQNRTLSTYATLYDGTSKLNEWQSVVPNMFVYTREGQTYTFRTLEYGVAHIGASLNARGDKDGFTLYDYKDDINVVYDKDVQRSTAPGLIKINGQEIVGYDIRNKQLIINADNVVASLDFITKFANGTESKEPVRKEFARTLTPTTDWTAYENNATETTLEPQITSMQKHDKQDDEWFWSEETRTITATVKLSNSSQFNGWTSVDPNNIRFTREGVMADFGKLDYAVIKVSSNVGLVSSEGLTDTYRYDNTISVNYGSSSYNINMKSSTDPGTIIVQRGKEVTGHEFRNPQLVITDDNVTASLTYVTLFNDGTENTEAVSKVFSRGLTPYTNWSSIETKNTAVTGIANVLLSMTNQVADGNWSYANETRDITTTVTLAGSTQKNGWTSIDPNSIKYTRDGQTYDFGKITFSAEENGQNVTQSNSSALQDVYSYFDKIRVAFGSNIKGSQAPGTIYVNKPKEVAGYEIRNPQLVVNNDNVTATLTFVTLYNDGTEDTDVESKSFVRSLEPYTDWTSTETNANEQTSSAATQLISSNTQTDGEWSYARETHRINTTVTLAGSTQTNGWNAIEPNNIVFTRNGVQHKFNKLSFSASEAGHSTSHESSAALLDVYSYTDRITVTYGGNSKSSSAPGTINVQKNKQASGYEIRNPQLVVSDDNVTATLTFVTLYNDGTEDKDVVSKSFVRSLEPYTDWTSTETNANEQTSSASTQLISSNTQTDGEWSYAREARRINTTVTLAGSTQTNGWNAVDPNSIVYTRNGVQHKFDKLSFSASETGHGTTLANSTALLDTHNYVDQITVTYGNNSKSSSAPGTINVGKSKQITGHEIRNPELVVSDNNVTATLTYVTLYNDGTEDTEAVSKSFARSLTPYTNWASTEKNSNEQTGSANVSVSSSTAQSDGYWSYVKEVRDITTIATLSATQQTNGWTAEDPNSIKYTRDGQTYDFGKIDFSAAEAGHNVKLKTETSSLATYTYEDKISVTFGNNTKSSAAPGVINVEKEIVITGYEISNQQVVVEQNNVIASLTFTTLYSDGTKKDENISKTLPRSFTVKSNWSSNEANNSQNTGSATITLKSSQNKTEGDWSYVNETRDIKTVAKLAGSSQDNKWESVDPNKIVFSKNGKTYNFGSLSYNATEQGASVKQKSSDDDKTVYSYTDKISVSFGSNSFDSSAPGTITVDKPWNPDFPDSYGKFESVAVTATQNEGHNSWMYVVSIHFKNGTLPLLIRQNASAPDAIDNGLFTTSTDSRLNSAFYIKTQGKWVNAIASDESKHMAWKDVNGSAVGMLVYSTATIWGWDNGYQKGSHPTVFTNKYSAKLNSSKTVLTIYDKSGNVFATYKSAK